jgi:DHA2 family multidrug resistance protein-like MFS transporter
LIVAFVAMFGVWSDYAGFAATTGILSEKLQMSSFEATFVISAYALASASTLIVGGSLSDRYGHRRLIGVGASVMFFALLVSAVAPNGWIMAISRAMAGSGSALVTVSTLAAIADVFAKADRTRAYAVVTVAAAIAYIVAPLTAGYLIEQSFWRFTPLFAAPMCVVVLATLTLIPKKRAQLDTEAELGLDLLGFVLAIVTTLLLFATASMLTRSGAGVIGITFLAVSVGLLIILVVWETRVARMTVRKPILDVRLFKNRDFTTVVFAAVLGGFGVGAAYFLIAYLTQFVLEMSVVRAQLVLIPAEVAAIVAALMGPYVERRLGMGHTIAAGFGIACLAYTATATLVESALWVALVAFTVLGFAESFNDPSIKSAIVSSAKSEEAVALGAAATVTKLASTISLAIVTGVFASTYAASLHSTLQLLDLDRQGHAVEHRSLAAVVEVERAFGGHGAPRAAAFEAAFHHAFLSAMHVAMAIGAVTALGAAVIAWRRIGPGEPSR